MGILPFIVFIGVMCCDGGVGLPTTGRLTDKPTVTVTTPAPIFHDDSDRDRFIMKISADVLETKNQLNQLAAKYTQIITPTRESKSYHNIFVAFAVHLKDNVTNLGMGQIIRFTEVILNRGIGYDVRLGVFRCPQSGTYQFTLSIGAYAGLQLEIVNNGKQIGRVFTSMSRFGRSLSEDYKRADFNTPYPGGAASTTGIPASGQVYVAPGSKAIQDSTQVIVDLTQGDEVWVRHASDNQNDVIFGNGMTSFSGHLLSPAK